MNWPLLGVPRFDGAGHLVHRNVASNSHAFKNYKFAAGLSNGSQKGPTFHDSDYYKALEAVASYARLQKTRRLDAAMDKTIAVIGKSWRHDGCIYNKNLIE